MNESDLRDLERRLAASLHASAPHAGPDLADRLLRRTAGLQQRRGLFGLSLSAALGAAAVVVLAVALGLGIGYLIPRQNFVGGPSQSPMPSPMPSPVQSPTPPATETPSPVPSASAGAFENGNHCANDEAGYAVDYPADWWANERVVPEPPGTPIAPCVAFAEEPLELIPNSQLPPAVAISGGITEPPPEDASQPIEILSSQQVEVAGRPAEIIETQWTEDVLFFRAGDRLYEYRIDLPSGQTLLFSTHMNELIDAQTYEDYKVVLDTIMQTLEIGAG